MKPEHDKKEQTKRSTTGTRKQNKDRQTEKQQRTTKAKNHIAGDQGSQTENNQTEQDR